MTTYHTITINGTDVFYREAGTPGNPVLLLLHGFPASSHMFRDLIPLVERGFHVIAPDYPGFGFSAAPSPQEFTYTFDNLAKTIDELIDALALRNITLYMHDYGGPVGFRIATRRPELIAGLIVQNAVAHLEGVSEALAPLMRYWESRSPENEAAVRTMLATDTTKFQYLHGAANPERIAPDGYTLDQALLDRPGNDAIQLELLYDYRTNPALFAAWQAYLHAHRPPTLVLWGKNDPFFTPAGALAYQGDNSATEIEYFDGGHFALEEYTAAMAASILARADRSA
jgi:pimeloyl-ACP methyl ester carboxylesterase